MKKDTMAFSTSHSHLSRVYICTFWQQIQTLSSDKKRRVGSVVMQWYAPHWETPWMRLPFTTNLDLYGNTRVYVRTQTARGDRPQDIHHLQGGILLCRHVRAQGYNSSWACFPSPGRRVRKGGRLRSLQAFYYVFPKTAVVQTDLTPTRKVCHQHSGPLTLAHSGWAGSITPAVTRLTV